MGLCVMGLDCVSAIVVVRIHPFDICLYICLSCLPQCTMNGGV